MILFDQVTRQFSVVEESREFAYRIGGHLLPFNFTSDREGPVSSIIRTAQGKDSQKLRAKNDKRIHQERMAMIRMGMDPSKLESQSVTQDRLRYADRSDKRKAKYADKADKRDYLIDRHELANANRVDARDTKVELRGLRNEDRADKRSNKTSRAEIKSKRKMVKYLAK